MTFLAIDSLVAALVAVCLYRVQVIQPTTEAIHEDYLSVESGKYARGLFFWWWFFITWRKECEGRSCSLFLQKLDI